MRHPGLFIGRFQPPHKGHVHALREILAQEEQVIIVIGSAQASFTPTNPFTTGERFMMLQIILNDLNIPCSRYQIIPVPDIHNYRKWVDHVKQYLPPFGIVYTGSETGYQLFSEQNIPVKKIKLYKKEIYSGTEIRRRMIQGEDWKPLVPEKVAHFVEHNHGINRLKSLNY